MDDSTPQNTTLISKFGAWFRHPFNAGGSAFSWVLFVGVLIIAAFLWQLVLLEIARGIEREA